MQKDPTLACLLNLLLLGTGHVYLGRTVKGIAILVIGIALGLLTLGLALIPLIAWAMFDAYTIAKKMSLSSEKADGEATTSIKE